LRTLILGNQFRSLALFFGDLPAPLLALFLFLAELPFVNGALSLLLGAAALNPSVRSRSARLWTSRAFQAA
jgi:hypothetical protein